MSVSACASCLRRAYLVAHLAPRIAGLLGSPDPRVAGLLGLPERELIAVATGQRRERALAFLEAFDAGERADRLEAAGVLALCRHQQGYPELLAHLDDPPAVIFGLGHPDALARLREEPAVAVVGTRQSSSYGREVARAFGRGLGAAGLPVVSGMALGIDGAAHRGCLEGNGVAVAVLACGPDIAYPRRHHVLHRRIRECGIVLSEMPPGQPVFRWSFPARNRIMAALTRLTVVVEAADPSGSLITADFARDLGRSVAAVPGQVNSRFAKGSNRLLKEGATPVTEAQDVLDELFGVGMRSAGVEDAGAQEPADARLAQVLAAAERCASVADIARETGLGAGPARSALGRLEAEGYLVRRHLGGWERAAR
jgi:DNA processing protein